MLSNANRYYRPDIDGLRAVAVLVVVFFHGGFSAIPGGYVGVDVFFVISGYLITSIIVREIDSNSFSILRFWERRVRRIVPPLAVVLLCTLVAAWWLLFPNELRNFAQSLLAQVLFASNILFWTESGYFEAAAELKPLQHTWSLAIEEQFYLLLPWLLMLLSGKLARYRFVLICLLTLSSLAISVYWTSSAPTTAFFLLPSRAWELLMGSLLVFLPTYRLAAPIAGLVSALGFGLIATACMMFDDQTRFPGVSALLPCVGAALIIRAHMDGARSLVYRLLSTRPLVFVGLISYSLYLWHWPLFAFARYHSVGELGAGVSFGIIVISFALSCLSLKYIETPIRSRQVLSTRNSVLSVAALVGIIFITVGTVGHFSNGFPARLNADVLHMYSGFQYTNPRRRECMFNERRKFIVDNICKVGVIDSDDNSENIDFLVVGDSHANSIMPLMDALAVSHGVTGLHPVYNGCPPMLYVYRVDAGHNHRCHQFNAKVIEIIAEKGIKHVLLVGRWSYYSQDRMMRATDDSGYRPKDWQLRNKLSLAQSKQLVYDGLDAFMASMPPDVKISILRQIPKQAAPISPRFLASRVWRGQDIEALAVDLDEHLSRQLFANEMIDNIAKRNPDRVSVIDTTSYLCVGTKCALVKQGGSLYRDDDHISTHGLQYIAPAFEDFFSNIKFQSKDTKIPCMLDTDESCDT